MLLTIILVLFTLMLSAYFSGSEIAFLSANKLGIEVLKNKGSAKGDILTSLYKNPKSFLSTMLVGNNIVMVMYAILFGSIINVIFSGFFEPDSFLLSFISTLLMTIVVLIFGEYVPKTIFRLYANELTFRLAYVHRFFKWLLFIPAWVTSALSNAIIRLLLGKQAEIEQNIITKLDLEHYINTSVNEEKDIDREILNNALHLGLLKVKNCMVPRNEIVFIDKNDDIPTIRETFISSQHSRLIVVDGDIENIVGYFHHQQLFKNPTSIKRHIMEIDFVPEVMNVQELMHKFIKDSNNIACVVDEFGGTAGIITLEDVLEEIFGEIEDEHDVEEFVDTMISETEYIFSGRIELDYINNKYENLELPVEDYTTLSGYIVMTHGSIPLVGDEIELDNYKFIILSRSDTRIETVKVIKLLDHSEKNIDENRK
ncbi:MAG: HlyC/CorC family transporter [Saprospiraceae bacterium]|nr:HlyC/CorC family transporter [Saprospiraceae bacterium]